MSDGIRKINLLRNSYKAQTPPTGNEVVRELGLIKNELRIANDVKAMEEGPITSATHSPYLQDQPYYKKEVLYNSAQETDWRQVRSDEENRREALIFKNLRRLNIL